jgi:hypothetical protein
VAKVAETRLRAVTHVVVMVSRFVHTELTAVNRAYKDTHTLDHEVHEKVRHPHIHQAEPPPFNHASASALVVGRNM